MIFQYEKRLIKDRKQFCFITSIVRFQTRLHAISSTKRFSDHSQFIEWIDESQEQLESFIDGLTVFHNSDDKDTFNYLHSELQFVLRDAKPLIEAKKKDVAGDEFWKGRQINDTKASVIEKIDNIIEMIRNVEDYDFINHRLFSEQPLEEVESTLCSKLVDVITKTIKEHKSSRPKGECK